MKLTFKYIDKDLNVKFVEKSNFVMQKARISYSLKLAVAQKLKFKISLKDIAKEYNISIATVQRIVEKFYHVKKIS